MSQLRRYKIMSRRSTFRVGDLLYAGEGHLADWRDALVRAPSWLIVAASCLSTLGVLAVGAAVWLAHTGYPQRPGAVAAYRETVAPSPAAVPETFPSWIEVPHLSEPRGRDAAAEPASGDSAGSSRSFLVPQPDMADRLVVTLAYMGSPSNAFGAVPLDVEAWIASAPDPARAVDAVPVSVEVATLPPPAAPTVGPATTMRARSILSPAPGRSVRSPMIEARRPARLGEDADQTASIIGLPRPARPRLDAGAVARASLHRTRAGPPSGSQPPAPPGPWTLPPALAPSP